MKLPALCGPRPDGRYYLTDPRTRRPVYLGYDRQGAERAHVEWCRAYLAQERETPGVVPGAPVTVAELCASYLAWAEVNYRKRNRQTSEVKNLKLALECVGSVPGLAHLPADHLTPLKLKAARDEMIRRGWCRDYVNAEVGRVRRVWRWGVEHELVLLATLQALETIAPLRKGKTSAPEAPPVGPVEWWVVEATLPYLTPRWRPLVLVHWFSGMRLEEVVAMRVQDVDCAKTPWIYTVGPDWNKKDHRDQGRVVPLGPRCRELLAGPLDRARQREGGWVWASRPTRPRKQPGTCLTPQAYWAAVDRAQDRANRARALQDLPPLPRWSPLQIRHAALTRVRERFGLEAAQGVGGHEELRSTQVYAERRWNLALEAAEALG